MSSLFSAPKINYTPPSFSGGGINATFAGNRYNLGISPQRSQAVGQLASTFGQQAGEIAGLRPTVAPGFSLFRQAGLSDLSNQQSAFMSNLSENMARRRVLGSSFASDAASRAERDFDAQRQDFIAKSYLQELEASNQLIQEQYQASTSQYKTFVDEMNLEAGLAAQLTTSASSAMASVAMAQAKLDAEAASNVGKLFGTVGAIAAAPFTGGLSLAAIPGLYGGMGTGGGSGSGGGS